MFIKALIIAITALVSSPIAETNNVQDIASFAASRIEVVAGFDEDIYRMPQSRGETTTIRISGDGDSDLDILVYNPMGQIVIRTLSDSDQESVTFTTAMAGTYTIVVKNYGARANLYEITAE